jgi:hypothetical protein
MVYMGYRRDTPAKIGHNSLAIMAGYSQSNNKGSPGIPVVTGQNSLSRRARLFVAARTN